MIIKSEFNNKAELEKLNDYDNVEYKYSFYLLANSFLVCFGKSYINRHKLISYPVKGISFKKNLSMDLVYLVEFSKLNNQNLNFIFVFYNFKPFNSNYPYNLDFEGNMSYADFNCIYFNIREFAIWMENANEEHLKNSLIIFNDFANWSDITTNLFLASGMHIEGENSSKRHIFSHLSLRLSKYLFILSFNNIENLNSLLVTDKSKLKPKINLIDLERKLIKEEKDGKILLNKNALIEDKAYVIETDKWERKNENLINTFSEKLKFFYKKKLYNWTETE